MDDLTHRTTVAAVWSALQSLLARGMAIPVFLVLARTVAPVDFGVVAVAVALIVVAQMILDQGVSAALIQRKDLSAGHCDAAFWMNVVLGLLLTSAFLALSGPLSTFFGTPALQAPLCVLSTMLIFEAFGIVPVALLTRELELKSIAVRSTVAGLLAGVAAIAAALVGAGLWALVIQQMVYSVVGLALVWRLTPWRPSLSFELRYLKELAPIGVPVFGTNMLVTIYRRADDLIIGKALGAVSLGYYTIAYRLLLLLNDTLLGTLSRVTLPAFSRTQNDHERLERGLLRATAMSSLLAFPAFAALAALGPDLVAVLFGPQWTVSGRVLALLAPAGIAHTLAYLYSDVLLALGRSVLQFGLWAARTALHVAGFLVGVRWGVEGVALSFTITSWMMLPIDISVVSKVTGIRGKRHWSALRAQFVGALVVLGVVLGFHALVPGASAWLTVLAAGPLSLAAAWAVIYMMNPTAVRDLASLRRRARGDVDRPVESVAAGNGK